MKKRVGASQGTRERQIQLHRHATSQKRWVEEERKREVAVLRMKRRASQSSRACSAARGPGINLEKL